MTNSQNANGNEKERRYPTVTVVLNEVTETLLDDLINRWAMRHPEFANRKYRTTAYFRHLMVEDARREGLL